MSYCSTRCRDHDARGHQAECCYLRRNTSDTSRLMLRLLARGGQDEGEALPGGGLRCLGDLLDHRQEVLASKAIMDKVDGPGLGQTPTD